MNGYKLIAGAIVRHLLTVVCGALVTKGWMDSGTASGLPIPEMAIGIVGIIGTTLWSLWQKAKAKWKFLEALDLRPGTHPAAAENIIEAKPRTIPGTIAALTK